VHAQHDVHAQSLHAFYLLSTHVGFTLFSKQIPRKQNNQLTDIQSLLRSNLKQHKLVKACAAYTFCGWLATVLVLFLNCHPFSGYWTLPPPQEECATYFRYEVTQCVFNISSDLAMFSIILPMLFKLQMKWRTKVPILFIFSMGLVVVRHPSRRLEDNLQSFLGSIATNREFLGLGIGHLRLHLQILHLPRHLGHQLPILVPPRSLHRHVRHEHSLRLESR
jgi:hypothetical protein